MKMSPKGHLKVLGTSISEMYQSKVLYDVTIISRTSQFKCHRLVLAAFSPYFRAMFTSGMQENLAEEITIDTDPKGLASLINWFYTGQISITEENVQLIMESGNFFGVSSICDSCINFLMQELNRTPSLCPSLYELGMTLGMEKLQEASALVWGREFHNICKTEEFLETSFETLTSFLQRDVLCVEVNGRILLPNQTEDYLLGTLLEYIEYQLETRISHIVDVQKLVRLHLCSKVSIDASNLKICEFEKRTTLQVGTSTNNILGLKDDENSTETSKEDHRKHPAHTYVKTHRYRLSRQDHMLEKFEDLPPQFGYITGLKIWMHRQCRGHHGIIEIPCGLQVFYNDGSTVHHGGSNPRSMTNYEFHLTPDERITEVYLHTADEYGTFICDLSFKTDLGRTMGPFVQQNTAEEKRKTYKAGARLGNSTSLYLASVRGLIGAFSREIPPHNSHLMKLGFVFGKFNINLSEADESSAKLHLHDGTSSEEDTYDGRNPESEPNTSNNLSVICSMCGK